MIREEYIEEIKKYILSAELLNTFNADFNEKKNNKPIYPSFKEVLHFVNKAKTSDIFFERLFLSLENYKKFVESDKPTKSIITYEPLLSRIKRSETTINKLLQRLNLIVDFEEFPLINIQKNIKLLFDEQYAVSLKSIYDLLEILAHKVQQYIKTNFIFSNAYKIAYEESINEFREKNSNVILSEVKRKLKNVVDKKYISDFLSDDSEDLVEMMNAYWYGFSTLLYFTKPIENISYEIDGETVLNIKEWMNVHVKNHYRTFENLLNNGKIFNSYTDVEVRDLYESIIKIKISKEISPRSEEEINKLNLSADEKKLADLIGLDTVKEAIEKIKAYIKANKLEDGESSNLNLHMTFTGNPGTGKTEVAKLIGEILYENGALPTNKYVEATRSDLVAGYVGQTALKTKHIINNAMGGVLFIDEAYSLVHEDDPLDYGNEAVAELIKAMEDYKGKFCVIFAGYKIPMEKMLKTNPGFNSRIQFHVDFPNYSRDELKDIFRLMLDKDNYLVSEDALSKMLDITDVLRKNPDFANARDARNILQQCEMNLNLRSPDGSNRTIFIEDVNKYIKDAKLNVSSLSNPECEISSGEEELMRLIGLDNIKASIKKIKAFAKKNKDSSNLNLHMAFTGNPGTGKTEVANIISRILFEIGVLPEAKVIIGDKETLVSQYVGQTAIKTKEAVEKAMGGVLFIDEAYSLSNGSSADFGSEAISTLINEMEKNKGKFCLILAGYEKPLKNMIATNPGFSSRIQFYLDFPDYSRDELKKIALSFLKKETVPYTIDENAMQEILNITDYYRTLPDFANARTVRKILVDVIMNQNVRTEEELNDNKVTLDDVIEFEQENNLNIYIHKYDNHTSISNEYIDMIKDASLNYDLSKVDNLYYEQAVISISGLDKSQGTGFIVTPNGICLTCAHCLSDNVETQKTRIILVLSDGQKFKNYVSFKLLYKDDVNDFAIIKLEENGMIYKYIPLTLENESKYESLQGFIMAGFPFGGETFTSISITDGKIASINKYGNRTVVFADMFGKPGNSGSPIIDKITKKVIGVYFGGISDPNTNEMINCFTPIIEVWKSIK